MIDVAIDVKTDVTIDAATDVRVAYDEYVDLQAKLDLLRADRQNLIDSILTPKQLVQIAEIEEEFGEILDAGEKELKAKTERLKNAILKSGVTFKGEAFQIIYTKGRVRWDDQKLHDMVFDYPPLVNARSMGKPYAVIRTRKST